MHKSKGKEFDNVYMLITDPNLGDNENRRKLYVAMTRARNNLYIHYTSEVYDQYAADTTVCEVDDKNYDKPYELIMQLSHRDVYFRFDESEKEV